MKKTNLILQQYYEACKELMGEFVRIYYKESGIEDTEVWWVSNNIGTVACINDYYWNMEDMATAIKHNISEKVLFDWYDTTNGGSNINLINYLDNTRRYGSKM